jgi:nucleoside-diphosphate-sugar epimerase
MTSAEQTASPRRVAIIGGGGFIGRHVAGALAAAGHQVETPDSRRLNLARCGAKDLAERIAGADTLINCAGLAQDRAGATMEAIHADGAARLFEAARAAGVRRVIHVSALGVSPEGAARYQRSKSAAEEALRRLGPDDPDWCVLRPSLVVGRGGASSDMLGAVAALPFAPRITPDARSPGAWEVRPVHVADLAALAVRLVERQGPLPRFIDAVGPEPMTIDALIDALRRWLRLSRRPLLPTPLPLLRAAASVGGRIGAGPLNSEILAMLAHGAVSDPGDFALALGRPPRPLAQALALDPAAPADRWRARLYFLAPLLRWSLGLLWVATALLSFGLYPVERSYEMLALTGLTGSLAAVALHGAAALDLLLGALLLLRWRPALVGVGQIALMAVFSLIALRLPAEYWLHPFTPLLKNLPLAAATLTMIALEDYRQ